MIEIFGTRVGEIVHWDCNNIEVFVKRTVQQHCQMLIIENSWIYDYGNSTVTNCSHACIHLQLREVTIPKATTWSECLCKSFVLFVGLFLLTIAFESLLLDASSGNGTSFHTFAFSFLALGRQNHPSSWVNLAFYLAFVSLAMQNSNLVYWHLLEVFFKFWSHILHFTHSF